MTLSTPGTRALAAVVMLAMLIWLGGCSMQQRFDSPDQAVSSLVDSLRAGNDAQLHKILGREGAELLYSGDTVSDDANVQLFLGAYDQKHELVALDESAYQLNIGPDGWPMPIPVIKEEFSKKWVFDTASGKDEILNRRIGRNELDTIQTCLAIVDAQREYAERDPQGVGFPVYAQKFFSDPGKKNGLYWETTGAEPLSPLGPLAAEATSEGYTIEGRRDKPQPYHGYYFRLLKAQGPAAEGGARDYQVGDHLLGGFAVVAYPATYGTSGIMTFIVNQDGAVYQRDLGWTTAWEAGSMKTFNPDRSWKKVDPDEPASTQAAR